MKNFKSNDTAINFLRKNKVRLQSLAAAVIVASSLTGCKEKNTIEPTTPADIYVHDTVVITSDVGKKYIVKRITRVGCENPFSLEHYHYYDVVTKNYYSDDESCNNYAYRNESIIATYINVANIESISDYLTTEEITKLMKDELSIDDCTEIIIRIKESEKEKVKTK